VLTLGVVASVLVLAAGLGLLLAAQGARGRAQAAADLAALAGAAELRSSGGVVAAACGVARESATRNRAAVVDCRVGESGSLRVRAVVRSPAGAATADARAGPRPVDGR